MPSTTASSPLDPVNTETLPRAAAVLVPGRPSVAPAASPRKRREARTDAFATVVVVAVMLLAMEVASRFVPDYIMPSPGAVLRAAQELTLTDTHHVIVTLLRLTAAVAFAIATGVLMGLAMGILPWARPYLKAIVTIDSGIPALSWMLIAVFWFKNAEIRIFFILTVILVPFYAINVYEGIQALSKDLIDMIESFRASRWQMLRYLILPHIVAYIFITTKSVIGYAIRMVVFAELVASAIGIGSRMSLAQSMFRIDQVFAWTFFLVILNIALQQAVQALETIVMRWRPQVEVR